MKRMVLIVAVLAAAGCGEPATPPADGAQQKPADSADGEETRAAMVGQDMNLHFYDKQQRTEGEEKPTFSLFSPSCSLDEEGVWSFKEASAVIYSSDGAETHMKAGEGHFDRTNEEAMLSGGVTMQMGTMAVGLEDMQWRNEERVAYSDNPVAITDGETQLRAASFQFHPDEKSLVLTDVTGMLVLEENAEQ